MNILVDTNVVLDVMLDRQPFVENAAALLSKVESGEVNGFLCATTITTVHYLATKVVGAKQAQKEIEKLFTLFDIAPVNRSVLEKALKSKFTDYEDAVLHEAAYLVEAKAIITRDIKGFKKATIPVYEPDEFLKVLSAIEN